MVSSNLCQELLGLLSHPSIVGPDGVPPGTSEFDIQTFERAPWATTTADFARLVFGSERRVLWNAGISRAQRLPGRLQVFPG